MIKFITVWVLTVQFHYDTLHAGAGYSYQLQYATQNICEKQRQNHRGRDRITRCDFQQVPVYVGAK
ncbi:hypothetical protein ACJCFO_002874 [Acinetobacter baumannii]|nr:hypothetical protein [Acinetobacter baumannii]EKU8237888.1 hypothetical protein [Acinetobacter baumannii]EKU8309814.1 hypothetical protein [Acinetobacter baumannii]EKU8413597.1 hypothetical protein [Acinetobacter baumannii]EKU9263387.1 hypothetical protein [Acinetobacter baumannii]